MLIITHFHLPAYAMTEDTQLSAHQFETADAHLKSEDIQDCGFFNFIASEHELKIDEDLRMNLPILDVES